MLRCLLQTATGSGESTSSSETMLPLSFSPLHPHCSPAMNRPINHLNKQLHPDSIFREPQSEHQLLPSPVNQ